MVEIPIEVARSEAIVRGVFTPFHVSGTKLKWAAFRPPALRRDVSVIRHDYLGTTACRDRAKAMGKAGKGYLGLLCIKVFAVRDRGPEVVDSREQFLGHADILHQIVLQAQEPPDSANFLALREVCTSLVGAAVYHPDPAPDAGTWTGEPL